MTARCMQTHFLIAALLMAWALPCLACGPFPQDRLLTMGDRFLLQAPTSWFEQDLLVACRTLAVPERAQPLTRDDDTPWQTYGDQTAKVDMADLLECLTSQGVLDKQRILTDYGSARKMISAIHDQAGVEWREPNVGRVGPAKELSFPVPSLPDGIPAEFREYFEGAVAYHQGERNQAISVWTTLLERPEEQRHFKSTWAAFMLGRSVPSDDEAIQWFRKVREMALRGFSDGLGLASASLGWEAHVNLNQGKSVEALDLYAQQLASGDRGAVESLEQTCSKALTDPEEELVRIAQDPLARQILTDYMTSRGCEIYACVSFDPDPARRWFAAVKASGVASVEGAERLALAAYQIGDMEAAESWSSLASRDLPLTHWVRAKLRFREGKIDEGRSELKAATGSLEPEADPMYSSWSMMRWPGMGFFRWEPMEGRIRGELGILELKEGHFVEAMDTLARGGYWEDAAYVAERVLSTAELKGYVDQTWPEAKDARKPSEEETYKTPVRSLFRHLLGRRLTREGRFEEATPYFPAELRDAQKRYGEGLRIRQDEKRSKQERADGLWDSALIARYLGMEILGTELEPDWSLYGGGRERTPLSQIRRVSPGDWKAVSRLVEDYWVDYGLSDRANSSLDRDVILPLYASKSELERLAKTGVHPEKRFHYRYVAAELAKRAADLLPNDSDRTAFLLCAAGTWLKNRDPEAADRYYKALVRRCRHTDLGRLADESRWFPPIDLQAEAARVGAVQEDSG